MGYMRHDAIVVASWNESHLEQAHTKAMELGLLASNIVDANINDERSFFVAPDGSKEGWEPSNRGDALRAEFISWLRDSELYVDWVAVSFGGDEPVRAHIVDHNK